MEAAAAYRECYKRFRYGYVLIGSTAISYERCRRSRLSTNTLRKHWKRSATAAVYAAWVRMGNSILLLLVVVVLAVLFWIYQAGQPK